jgi:glycosyltransferase involved in cell wall biosynthesis
MGTTRSRVYIFQNRIPDYRVPFFLQLIKSSQARSISVNIFVSSKSFQQRGDEARKSVPHQVIKNFYLQILKFKFDIFLPRKKYLNADLYIVEFGIRNIAQILFLRYLGRGKLAFWGHGEENSRSYSRIELVIRSWILGLADFYFAYTKSGRDYLIGESNFRSDRVFVVNNSTDTSAILDAKRSNDGQTNLTLPLDLKRECDTIFLAISSLEKSKNVELVWEIHRKVREVIPHFKILICGEGPQREFLEKKMTTGIYLLGRISPAGLAQLSKIAIGIVAPGPVGLVVTDSFAMGIPIITSLNQCHSPEFSYLENEENCLIVKHDLQQYADAIYRLSTEPALRKKLGVGLRTSLDSFSIEIMVKNFLLGIESCLGQHYE